MKTSNKILIIIATGIITGSLAYIIQRKQRLEQEAEEERLHDEWLEARRKAEQEESTNLFAVQPFPITNKEKLKKKAHSKKPIKDSELQESFNPIEDIIENEGYDGEEDEEAMTPTVRYILLREEDEETDTVIVEYTGHVYEDEDTAIEYTGLVESKVPKSVHIVDSPPDEMYKRVDIFYTVDGSTAYTYSHINEPFHHILPLIVTRKESEGPTLFPIQIVDEKLQIAYNVHVIADRKETE